MGKTYLKQKDPNRLQSTANLIRVFLCMEQPFVMMETCKKSRLPLMGQNVSKGDSDSRSGGKAKSGRYRGFFLDKGTLTVKKQKMLDFTLIAGIYFVVYLYATAFIAM